VGEKKLVEKEGKNKRKQSTDPLLGIVLQSGWSRETDLKTQLNLQRNAKE